MSGRDAAKVALVFLAVLSSCGTDVLSRPWGQSAARGLFGGDCSFDNAAIAAPQR
ncbi:MAG: hypothetical protein H6747_11965 [Deltaproteobacteria bacterium]|nr:hypothetical protein [Deltaproteobacteria bacterium]